MARHPLNSEFTQMHERISLGDRALVAIAAHVEVRSVLRSSEELRSHDLDDVLIGSYARRVSIWPGKDVDVFGRLMADTESTLDAEQAYTMFAYALQAFADQGRLKPQPRSFRIEFGPGRYPSGSFIHEAAQEYRWSAARVNRAIASLDRLEFEFSVDVVPAVIWGEHYGIPEIGLVPETRVTQRTGNWRLTNPVELTEQTRERNRRPRINGVGGFVRIVKEIRQVKAHHLQGAKPSSLYYEFALHEGFREGSIQGDSWADLTSSALSYVASRLNAADAQPVSDPVLSDPYAPPPSASELSHARDLFNELAQRSRRALTADRCQAAIEWRYVFGGNRQSDHVFPLPDGCRSSGVAMGAATENVASGGTEERGFGDG